MIRLGRKEEVSKIMSIIEDAKSLFRSRKSTQWQDLDGYPNEKTILSDIDNNELFVYEINNVLVAVLVIQYYKEKAYETIYCGKWSDYNDYVVIHRVAVKKEFYRKGIAKKMFEEAFVRIKSKGYSSVRIDTTEENLEMNNLLIRLNFKKCGFIYLLRENVIDKKRIAYEKII